MRNTLYLEKYSEINIDNILEKFYGAYWAVFISPSGLMFASKYHFLYSPYSLNSSLLPDLESLHRLDLSQNGFNFSPIIPLIRVVPKFALYKHPSHTDEYVTEYVRSQLIYPGNWGYTNIANTLISPSQDRAQFVITDQEFFVAGESFFDSISPDNQE